MFIIMGNSKSKKLAREPENFFLREHRKEQKREEKKKKNAHPGNKRKGLKEPPLLPGGGPPLPPAGPGTAPQPPPAHIRSYDDEALDRMRYQLQNDSDAFLLNNILLSVQFFDNYEREVQYIRNNPITEREHLINEEMVRRHKHVFFADRLQESVQEHVCYQRQRGQLEPLVAPRLFVIYDNVEASEPGDTSDYSAVLDAPFYKLLIEDCKQTGYVKLKKLEVLESVLTKENETMKPVRSQSDDSVYTESEKDSNDSDDFSYVSKGKELLQNIETKLVKINDTNGDLNTDKIKVNHNTVELSGRRGSGPMKQVTLQVQRSNIINLNTFQKNNSTLPEEAETNGFENLNPLENNEIKPPRRSILKNPRRPSGPTKYAKTKLVDIQKAVSEKVIVEDTETSGYSENESDYGYATITESTTPKKVELSMKSNYPVSSGVLPEECWSRVQVRSINSWSDDEDEEIDDTVSKTSLSRNLYDTHYYLSSLSFMKNFVNNFIINLGSGLGISQDAVNNALTEGASIFCDTTKNGSKSGFEVFPALIAAWPNAANQWIIRERRIIQNPRTNFTYQWPTKYMVNKAIGLGCLLVPIGFRPKRGLNPDQALQWRIIFPAAERYLESCLAHSHMRCYLFALALQKTFMETEKSKIGIDASHIKNHLFWQCEDNYARWPEDRLGETLRLFLRTFYVHFGQARLPNYFVDSCNDFKSIPKPILLKLQKSLADILEAPVMHILTALDKLKYVKKDFYPTFNSYRLYEILTTKNPLRIINPALQTLPLKNNDSSDSEDDNDNQTNFWARAKTYDKQYQWQKERQRQMQERRNAQIYNKKQKTAMKETVQMNPRIILPAKMETERRRLVLEFFICHFIAMARSSERFEAIRQAVIYLEQAQRLCILLSDEDGGDGTANDYLDIVRDKLADCQRKLVNQGGFKLPRRESQKMERPAPKPIRKQRPRFEHIMSQDSPNSPDTQGISAFTFVDVHTENTTHDNVRLSDVIDEESKL